MEPDQSLYESSVTDWSNPEWDQPSEYFEFEVESPFESDSDYESYSESESDSESMKRKNYGVWSGT